MEGIYDLVIIGAGPAGLTAAIYAQRAQLNTLVLEKLSPGGQILFSGEIENYPGFSEAIPTQRLIKQMQKQAENLGMNLKYEEVESISQQTKKKIIHTCSGKQYETLAVIIAPGGRPGRLGIKGEEEFTGRGVSYCATCDAPFFRNQTVAVIGGGNTALEESLYLAKFAKQIYHIHRRRTFRGERILQERVSKNPKIDIVWNSVVKEIYGKDQVERIKLRNLKSNKTSHLACAGIFIFAGLEPNTEFVNGFLELDEKGFIKTDEKLETSVKGVFACGDVRNNFLKQVVVACGEGALATCMAEKYINKTRGIEYK